MRWITRTGPLLAIFWLVLSGHFNPLFLSLGALSVGLVCWISLRSENTSRGNIPPRMVLRLPAYFLWLGMEVLRSSLAVTRLVWSPRPTLRPAMGVTPAERLSALGQATYANSITFTPGTLALTVDDDGIEVHSLKEADIAHLRAGQMLRRVRRLEGGS